MARHLVRMVSIALLIVLALLYPFFPGRYDPLAWPLSLMAQIISMVGLVLVPIGALWLVSELRAATRRKRNLPSTGSRRGFAVASLIAGSLVVLLVAAAGLADRGVDPRDQQVLPSHTASILIWTPEVLATRQGWYAVHDAPAPHWKYFWFD